MYGLFSFHRHPGLFFDGFSYRPVGAAVVLLGLSAISLGCSFLFGWTFGWPLATILILGFLRLLFPGDSPVLSAALSEGCGPGYLGALSAFDRYWIWRRAVRPPRFWMILDETTRGPRPIYTQGLAFSSLGFMGLAHGHGGSLPTRLKQAN